MSEHTSDYTDQHTPSADGNRYTSSQSRFDVRGPIKPGENHVDNDHFALIYEDQVEQFETVIPFIREGLERGEQCVYVADDNTVDEVLDAMRARGIDIDDALASGALRVRTEEDTYRRTGEFDREAMLEFWEDTLADATDREFTGLRATAEMTWALEVDDTGLDELCDYEELLNPLYNGEDYTVLCQYNRERFPAEILHDVLKTHPFLVYDSTTICQNFYYTPPEEYFGSDQQSRELDQKLATLVDRTDAREAIKTREQYQRRLYETIASPKTAFDEKINDLLELGCERLGLEIGYFTQTLDDTTFEIVDAVGNHKNIKPGVTESLCDTYCEKLFASPGLIAVQDAAEEGWTNDSAYERFGLDAYFGTTIHVGGEEYGTLCFASKTPREEPYTDAEQTFLDLMNQWVEYELERQHRERFLRESYQITADPDRGFDGKLEQLLELGREWFGLEMGGLNHLPSWGGEFRLEKGVGLDIDPEDELWSDPGYGCFCRRTIEADEPIAMPDVRDTEWQDDPIHRRFGLTSYLGTKVTSGSTPYGTLWFGSTESRDQPFSDTEHTFIELMGQWVSYEIERREHHQAQQKLYEIAADTDRTFEEKLRTVFDLGCERFGMEAGGIAIAEPTTDRFEVEITNGEHEHLAPGESYPLSETYCRVPANDGGTGAITDPVNDGFEGKLCYEQFGVRTYLGTYLELEDDVNRTFWFVSTEPREDGFSEAKRTFQHLMGQWVKYELERQQREEDLRERTEHLSALIETTPECIKTVAPDGTLLQMNPAGQDMVEAGSASDVIDENVYDLIAPDHRDRFREFNERICQGEEGTLEFDIIGLEGTRRHMETHAAPLHKSDGTTVHVALTRDITEQVEREQQLEETVTQLQQSNDRLKQFAYAASHDLQEPLRMVSSYLQLLETQYKDDLDEDAQEYIDFAVNGADRMRAMVNDLLAFSRVEQADGEFEPVKCDALLERVMNDIQMQIEEANAEITVQSLPTIVGDRSQLEQLFTNLVSNAIKYRGDDPPEIDIRVEEQDDHWEFSVVDNGIGIDPDKTDRIFEVFKRLHHEDEYPGTGIGLSLCQKIVENHGGEIWVDSEPGGGSTFFVTLPKRTAES